MARHTSAADGSHAPPPFVALLSIAAFVVGTIGSFAYANVDPLEVMAAEAKGCPVWCMAQLPFSAAHGFMLAILTFAVTWLIAAVRSRRRSRLRPGEF